MNVSEAGVGVEDAVSVPPWQRLQSNTVRVGPDLPMTWRAPPEQTPGPPEIVFLPGIGSDGRSWYRQAALAKYGRLAYFDNPMDIPDAPYTFDILALLLRDAVYELCDRPPVIVGASFGGMIALTYALTWPDALSGLILCGSCADVRWFRYPLELGARLVAAVPHSVYRATVPNLGRLSGFRDRQDREGRELFAEQSADMGPITYSKRIRAVSGLHLGHRLDDITTPALVLHGSQDQTVPLRGGKHMAEEMPNSTLRLLPGGRHNLYLNATSWFNTQVGDWLDAQGLP